MIGLADVTTLTPHLKRILPPKVSFALRSLKAQAIDSDTKAFRQIVDRLSSKESLAIDIGANFGIYSGIMSRSFQSLITVEPNPECISYLNEVLPPNCTVLPFAISDRVGFAELRIPFLNGRGETTRATISSTNTFGEAHSPPSRNVTVKTTTVDSIVEEYISSGSDIAFIKIDTEGHELASWRGSLRTIDQHRPSLCLEIERQHGDDAFALLGEIKDNGYVAVLQIQDALTQDHRFVKGEFDFILDDRGTANRYFVHESRRNLIADL